MAIEFACASCGHRFRVKDGVRGHKGTCPTCQDEVVAEGERVPDHDVFISHANQDKNVADAVCAALEVGRLRCWMAPRDVPAGKTWASSIIDAIEESRVMVLIFSGHSNNSDQVLREVERAVSKGVVIVPVRIEDVTMTKDLEYFLSARHWLDAFTEPVEKYTAQLTAQVKALIADETQPSLEELAPFETSTQSSSPPHISDASKFLSHYHTNLAATLPKIGRYISTLSNRSIGLSAFATVTIGIILFVALRPSDSDQKEPKSPPTTPPGETVARAPETTRNESPSVATEAATAKPEAESSAPQVASEPFDLKWTESGDQGVLTMPGGVEMEFVWCPPGTFMMGSPEDELGRNDEEGPRHEVTLTTGFWIGATEVSQRQWLVDREFNDSHFKGDDLPAENMTWDACIGFINKLNRMDAGFYRLPTEAEWEYACRAGTTTPYHYGETISTDDANYDPILSSVNRIGVDRNRTVPVGSFSPNDWGLYDMHGNVRERCSDWAGQDYSSEPAIDPQGPSSGRNRNNLEPGRFHTDRGGSFSDGSQQCRSAYRGYSIETNKNGATGFRLVRNPD